MSLLAESWQELVAVEHVSLRPDLALWHDLQSLLASVAAWRRLVLPLQLRLLVLAALQFCPICSHYSQLQSSSAQRNLASTAGMVNRRFAAKDGRRTHKNGQVT